MRRPSLVIGVAAVCVLVLLAARTSTAFRTSVRGGLLQTYDMDIPMNQLDSPRDMGLTPAPPLISPPFAAQAAPRFKAEEREVAKALNVLDLKSMNTQTTPAARGTFPRQVVAAYGTLAAETVQRASYALAMLGAQRRSLEAFLKVQRHDMMLWVAGQKKNAQQSIQQQIDAVGKLEDEISHLQRVFQDAIAKERSYQVQVNMLVAERQLQRTPPVMPVEVAVALTDAQYKEAVGKLNQYLAAAKDVIEQTKAHIMTRKNMANQLNDWIHKSNQTLSEWLHLQGSLIAKRVGETEKALSVNNERVKAVQKMRDDATASFKEFSTAVQRMDIKGRIQELQEAKKKWTDTAPRTPYDEAQIKAYVVALDLEIKAFEKRLAEAPGDEQVTPPPTIWGILAGFPSGPKVLFPEPAKTKLHPWVPPINTVFVHPVGFKAPLDPPTDPAVRFHVPTEAEHQPVNAWVAPTVPTDLGQSVTVPNPFAQHSWFPGAMAAVTNDPAMATSAEAAASAVGAAPPPAASQPGAILPYGVPVPPPIALPGLPSFIEQQTTVHRVRAPQMPSLPNLPPPPEADLVI